MILIVTAIAVILLGRAFGKRFPLVKGACFAAIFGAGLGAGLYAFGNGALVYALDGDVSTATRDGAIVGAGLGAFLGPFAAFLAFQRKKNGLS